MNDNDWPLVDDFNDIRPMTKEERQRAAERERTNHKEWQKCVSCGSPAQSDFCGFCLEEE